MKNALRLVQFLAIVYSLSSVCMERKDLFWELENCAKIKLYSGSTLVCEFPITEKTNFNNVKSALELVMRVQRGKRVFSIIRPGKVYGYTEESDRSYSGKELVMDVMKRKQCIAFRIKEDVNI